MTVAAQPAAKSSPVSDDPHAGDPRGASHRPVRARCAKTASSPGKPRKATGPCSASATPARASRTTRPARAVTAWNATSCIRPAWRPPLTGMLEKLIDDSGELVGRSFTHAHIDSWEVGIQNWTEGMAETFRRRNGYDLTPFYPLLVAGHAVESNDVSERFLWDLRQHASGHDVRELSGTRSQELCHENGLKFSSEAGGRQTFLHNPVDLLGQLRSAHGRVLAARRDAARRRQGRRFGGAPLRQADRRGRSVHRRRPRSPHGKAIPIGSSRSATKPSAWGSTISSSTTTSTRPTKAFGPASPWGPGGSTSTG